MADMCGYTAEHFSRIFRSFAGKSPKEYILDARLELATYLLEKTDKPIEIIIEECGFSNRTEFFKKFFDKMQITPLQYRKNQK
jgi:AraC-like DNA-binding protein